MRALHPLDAAFGAVADDDHQIHIAVVGRGAPGVGAEQINLLRLKLGFQPFDGFFQEALRNGLHISFDNRASSDPKSLSDLFCREGAFAFAAGAGFQQVEVVVQIFHLLAQRGNLGNDILPLSFRGRLLRSDANH